MDIACFVVSFRRSKRNNKTSNTHAWRYFETSIVSFSELREPILMILGAKWPQSKVLSGKQNEKKCFENVGSVFWEKLIFIDKTLQVEMSGAERKCSKKVMKRWDISKTVIVFVINCVKVIWAKYEGFRSRNKDRGSIQPKNLQTDPLTVGRLSGGFTAGGI